MPHAAPRNPWEPTPYAPGQAQIGSSARANELAFRKAFAVGLILFVLTALGLHLSFGLTSYEVGRLLAGVLLMPAVICGLIARTRRKPWGWTRYLTVHVVVALLLGMLTSAGRVPGTTPVSALPADDLKRDSRAVSAGIFTGAESDCVVERLMRHPGLTVGQIDDHFRAPEPGAVEKAYAQIVPACVDPGAVVEPARTHPVFRESFINGLRSSAPEFTVEEAGCLLDSLLAQGVSPRAITLAGYDEQRQQQLMPHVDAAVRQCVPAAAAG